MEINEVFDNLKPEINRVEALMLEKTRSDVPLVTKVCHYVIKSGGKRIRPALLILSSNLCGYQGEKATIMAAVMEFTHTATLLHDDVIDGADIRRGQTAANRVWNSAISVLTGDFLLSLSINMVLQIRNDRVLDILSSTARKMSEGEIFQQSKTGDINISEEDYMKIITAKTALLFSASCKIGAVLGSVPEEKIKQMEDFGINLGQAFQLVDDFLDYVSTESDLGKAIGKDLGESKITLPLIYTLKKCDGKEKEFIEKVIEAKDLSDSNLESIIKIINRYGGIDYTRNMAQEMIDKSLRCLDGFDPESPDRKMLTTLAQFIVSRDR